VTALVKNGVLAERYAYDPYGQVTFLTTGWVTQSSSPNKMDVLFQGKRYDAASKTYDFNARAYSPSLGRFLSQDPKQYDAGDANFYRFVGDGPVNGIDPSGMAEPSRAQLLGAAPYPQPLPQTFILYLDGGMVDSQRYATLPRNTNAPSAQLRAVSPEEGARMDRVARLREMAYGHNISEHTATWAQFELRKELGEGFWSLLLSPGGGLDLFSTAMVGPGAIAAGRPNAAGARAVAEMLLSSQPAIRVANVGGPLDLEFLGISRRSLRPDYINVDVRPGPNTLVGDVNSIDLAANLGNGVRFLKGSNIPTTPLFSGEPHVDPARLVALANALGARHVVVTTGEVSEPGLIRALKSGGWSVRVRQFNPSGRIPGLEGKQSVITAVRD
jgi:RHS repeat-associated protein